MDVIVRDQNDKDVILKEDDYVLTNLGYGTVSVLPDEIDQRCLVELNGDEDGPTFIFIQDITFIKRDDNG